MSGGASRARLIELRALLSSAERGREVLERKRELLLYELRRRAATLVEERRRVAVGLATARESLGLARVELGVSAVDAAVMAQPAGAAVELRSTSILGVPVPRLSAASAPFRPAYGPGGTSASLDRAGAAFAALLPDLARLAEAEATALALRRGLRKTARRVCALERVVIPRLRDDLHAVRSGIEEEERESVRRRTRMAGADPVAGERGADGRRGP